MKNLGLALFLLSMAIACTAAFAQSSGAPSERQSPQVTQAHCQYTPTDPACEHQTQAPRPGQCRQQAPCPSPCCPYGYPPRPPFLFQPENGTHAAAGALIGLGLGVALGAARDPNGGSRIVGAVVVGGFGALIGAAIGHGIPAHPWHRRRHPDWDDPDENAMTPRPNPPTGTDSGRLTAPPDRPSGT